MSELSSSFLNPNQADKKKSFGLEIFCKKFLAQNFSFYQLENYTGDGNWNGGGFWPWRWAAAAFKRSTAS
jgi:hypothetical protein